MLRFLLLALVAALAPAAAQPTGVYLTGSLARSQFQGEAFTQFNDTYSEFFVRRLDGPVALLPTEMVAPTLGALGRVNLGGVAFGFGYTLARERTEERSTFENGAGNRVGLRTQSHAATVELTTDALGPLVVGGTVGGMFRGVRIENAAIHADGSESIGSEYTFNGVYTASAAYLEVGGVAALRLGDRLLVPVRAVWPINFAPTGGIPVQDYEVNGLVRYFPSDYLRYRQDQTGLSERDVALMDEDFIGPRVQVGLEVRLF